MSQVQMPPPSQQAQKTLQELAKKQVNVHKTTNSNVTALGTKPGVKQNIIYNLKELSSTLKTMFTKTTPYAGPVPSTQSLPPSFSTSSTQALGFVVGSHPDGSNHIIGIIQNGNVMSLQDAQSLVRTAPKENQTLKDSLDALKTGTNLKAKDSRQKIGSKIEIKDGQLLRYTGMFSGGREHIGELITLDAIQTALTKPLSSAEATQAKTVITNLSKLDETYGQLLTQLEPKPAEGSPKPTTNVVPTGNIQEPTPTSPQPTPSSPLPTPSSPLPSPSEPIAPTTPSSPAEPIGPTVTITPKPKITYSTEIQPEIDKALAATKDQLAETTQDLSTLKTTLEQTYSPKDTQLILDAYTHLSHVAEHLDEHTTIYDSLPKTHRSSLLDQYNAQVFNPDNPATAIFLRRTSATINSIGDNQEAAHNLIEDLGNGDYETALLIQTLPHTHTTEPSSSTHLDFIVQDIGIHGENQGTHPANSIRIRHALRHAAINLVKELPVNANINTLTSVLFDKSTIKTLVSQPGFKSKELNIFLGKIVILQHQIEPSINVEETLKEVGIHASESEINSYFDSGLKGELDLQHTLNTLTKFSKSMHKNKKLQKLLTQTLTNKIEILSEYYHQDIIAKTLHTSGTDDDQRQMLEPLLASKTKLGTAKLKRTRIAGRTVLSGAAKTKLKSLIKHEKTTVDVLQRLNEKSVDLKPALDTLSTLNTHLQALNNLQNISTTQDIQQDSALKSQLSELNESLNNAISATGKSSREKTLVAISDALNGWPSSTDLATLNRLVTDGIKQKSFKHNPEFPALINTFITSAQTHETAPSLPSQTLAKIQSGDLNALNEVMKTASTTITTEHQRTQLESAIKTVFSATQSQASKTLESMHKTEKKAAANLQPLKTMIRLSMLDLIQNHSDSDTAIQEIQSGTHTDAILRHLQHYGLTDTMLTDQGGTGIKDLKGLVQYETTTFKGADSVKAWMGKITLSSAQTRDIAAKAHEENTEEFKEITGKQSLIEREVGSWMQDLGSKGKLMINWGKGVSISTPEALKYTQEAFLGGVSIGGSASSTSDKLLLVEEHAHPTQKDQNYYTITLDNTHAKSLGINVEAFDETLSAGVEGSRAKTKGLQLSFKNKEALTLFFTGLMTDNISTTSLANIQQIMFVDGTKYTLKAEVSFGYENPLDGYLPEVTPPTLSSDNLNTALESALSVENKFGTTEVDDESGKLTLACPDFNITASAEGSRAWRTTKNLHETKYEKTSAFTASLETGGLKALLTEYANKTGKTDVSATDFSISIKTHNTITYQSGVLHEATITKECEIPDHIASKLFPGSKAEQALKLIYPGKLSDLKTEHPETYTQLVTDLKAAQPGDNYQIQWELPAKTRLTISELSDPASPIFNRKKAQQMLADQKLYVPTSIRRLTTLTEAETSTSKGIDALKLETHNSIKHLVEANKITL